MGRSRRVPRGPPRVDPGAPVTPDRAIEHVHSRVRSAACIFVMIAPGTGLPIGDIVDGALPPSEPVIAVTASAAARFAQLPRVRR